ncbi:MAG: hypothetical protein IID06_00225 [Gemmatimonadetes bacterium]|nr:hypothetical protein [Gemmatimonadota bacterium]
MLWHRTRLEPSLALLKDLNFLPGEQLPTLMEWIIDPWSNPDVHVRRRRPNPLGRGFDINALTEIWLRLLSQGDAWCEKERCGQ